MKIDKQAIDNLHQIISIHIEKDDYQKKFNSELQKQASKAQLKGFRKGKTPAAVIRKMYGKNVLADVINETLQGAISNYITEEKLDVLGQPIPADDQDGDIDFNVNKLQDYTFKYEIGVAPEINVEGVSEKDSYDIYKVEIDDKTIDEELEIAKKKLGTQSHPDGQVEENDILTIQANELDGKKEKKDGWATEFTVMVNMLNEDKKAEVLKLSKGDSFTFNIYELEKDKSEDYVKKYLLNIDEAKDGDVEVGNEFTGKISDISRLVEAEINQEFYDKYFGEGEVKTEEEAREKVAEFIGKHYENQALQVMYRNIMDELVANTKVELPAVFLKKWLKITNEKLSDEEIEKDFDGFLDNMKWTLIKSKLSKQFEVDVQPEDIREAMAQKVRSYFGQYGMDESYMGDILNRMLQNQEEVNKTYEELQAGKLFEKIGNTVGKKENSISIEKFNEAVKELNEKHQG
mgnify:CR=1 FL=1